MPVSKISVIMPVYNTPVEYLEECLDSVFSQTFSSFELICVDDASDDRATKALIGVYQNRHETMKVIRLQCRSGAAAARNMGFLHAKSDYVIFLDADDIFGKNFLSEMYQCVEKNQADFCACGYTEFRYDGRERECTGHRLEAEKAFDKDADNWLASILGVPWNKLCRRRFLEENNIYFQSLSSCNDVFFHCMCMICAQSLCVLEREDLVFYRTGTKEQISADRDPRNLYRAVVFVLEAVSGCDSGEKVWNWGGALLILGMLNEISRNSKAEKKKELYLLVREFFRGHQISFGNRILQAYQDDLLQLEYESGWYDGAGGLLWQLGLYAEEIKALVAGYRDIYVWGRGKRGDAFQQFCKKEGLTLSGVADIKDSDIGRFTEYGNRIIDTREILEKEGGLIVASNWRIYRYLKGKVRCSLMNLEEFCPM